MEGFGVDPVGLHHRVGRDRFPSPPRRIPVASRSGPTSESLVSRQMGRSIVGTAKSRPTSRLPSTDPAGLSGNVSRFNRRKFGPIRDELPSNA